MDHDDNGGHDDNSAERPRMAKMAKMDTLALADAMTAIIRAAEAMADAGDLLPVYPSDLDNGPAGDAELRRLALMHAIIHARKVREAGQA